jgi:hypothetical protein
MPATQQKPHRPGRARAPARPSPTGVLPGQLAFPFAARTVGGAATPGRGSGKRSRRALRTPTAARLGGPLAERPPEERALEQSLAALMPAGRSVTVKLTDNRYTMVMVRRGSQQYTLRAHRMFAGAEVRLLRALARYVVHNDPRASAVIGAFIDENQHAIRGQPRRARRIVLRTAGQAHDLATIYDRLNREYFDGQLEARITWGSAPRRQRPRHSIKMGSFAMEDRIIRIHPALDHASVPGYFVAWIVFHEMLHGKYAVVQKGDRRCFHTKEFVAEERSFREYQRAHAWERANMERLLGG